MTRITLSLVAVAALAACGDDVTQTTWTQEAGLAVNDGGFGNPTMSNALVQMGARDAMVTLSHRFDAAVPTVITFAFDSATLDAEAQRRLRAQADFINQFPEVRFAVYGHTDLVGSAEYNYQLGLRRAQAAVAYLVTQGVDRGRLEALVSQGETQPLVPTGGRERRNRRAETDVIGFSQAGGDCCLNGQYAAIIFRNYVSSAGGGADAAAAGGGDAGGAAPAPAAGG